MNKKNKQFVRRILEPSSLYFIGSKTSPLSKHCGFDRGTPLDRYYIENFIRNNSGYIKGTCLELLNNNYTIAYGKDKVVKSDILDIDRNNKNATIIDDIRNLKSIADDTYNCIILTQVLQFIDNTEVAISECRRILKPGGVILATLPSLSRIDISSGIDSDYWRFTTASTRYLFEKFFSRNNLLINSVGNAKSGIYFYAGLSVEETRKKILNANDPNFPLIITVRAIK